MRGTDEVSGSLFSYVELEERIPVRHPLREMRQIVNDALTSLDAEFDRLYAAEGRPSIAPERLLRASLIQILFSVRSERQLMEQMQYNLLFRWFVGLGIDDPVWVPTVFTKNRDRLLTTDMSRKFLVAILAHREVAPLLSDEHFSVDGTLVKAWASMKGFQPKAEDTPGLSGIPCEVGRLNITRRGPSGSAHRRGQRTAPWPSPIPGVAFSTPSRIGSRPGTAASWPLRHWENAPWREPRAGASSSRPLWRWWCRGCGGHHPGRLRHGMTSPAAASTAL
jgi:transposase